MRSHRVSDFPDPLTAIHQFKAALSPNTLNAGFRNFPDPSRSGELTHEMLTNDGLNLHQPAFRAAAETCTSVTHGLLTRASVARFAAGQ